MPQPATKGSKAGATELQALERCRRPSANLKHLCAGPS